MAQVTTQSIIAELKSRGITNLEQLVEQGLQGSKEQGAVASGLVVRKSEDFWFCCCCAD